MRPRVESLPDQDGNHGGWMFYCPGCRTHHLFDKRWTFNGDVARPTFMPSLLVNGTRLRDDAPRCHSFVRDGRIQYLGDCDHELRGQTVDLPEVE